MVIGMVSVSRLLTVVCFCVGIVTWQKRHPSSYHIPCPTRVQKSRAQRSPPRLTSGNGISVEVQYGCVFFSSM